MTRHKWIKIIGWESESKSGKQLYLIWLLFSKFRSVHNNKASELLSNWARKTCLKLLPIHTVTLSGGLNHTYSVVQAKRSNQLATCQVADARVKDNVNIKIKDNNTNIITLINKYCLCCTKYTHWNLCGPCCRQVPPLRQLFGRQSTSPLPSSLPAPALSMAQQHSALIKVKTPSSEVSLVLMRCGSEVVTRRLEQPLLSHSLLRHSSIGTTTFQAFSKTSSLWKHEIQNIK